MVIEELLQVNRNLSDELSFRTNEVSVVTCENPSLVTENGEEIYMGDNPDIFGVFIGKDNPILGRVLDLIDSYDEEDDESNIIDLEVIGYDK